ncbi:hypothetical protein [Tenggerimyces flavus]|uniref:Uncharacterized protein n=1 Tax=Tenggerimyces flavus TaxID=1708749 RepID=A0ABV7Y6F7_9ACTN|nr:hypothetical protein [Tenggerimyces flavus]MBM7790095.1 hypothetical protein [Tenggerimyces flavus]
MAGRATMGDQATKAAIPTTTPTAVTTVTTTPTTTMTVTTMTESSCGADE